MITPEYVQTMARYNQWQNRNLYGAADRLDDMARRKDRGQVHAMLIAAGAKPHDTDLPFTPEE